MDPFHHLLTEFVVASASLRLDMYVAWQQVSLPQRKGIGYKLQHAATEVDDVQCYYRLKMEPLKLQLSLENDAG